MKKQLSDEQLDALMRTLVKEAGADEALLGEIADSPTVWWGVQRKINEQKDAKVSAWPPVVKVLRWLLAGASVTAAAILIFSFFVFRSAPSRDKETAVYVPPISSVTQPEPVGPSEIVPAIPNATKTEKDATLSKTTSFKVSTKHTVHQIVDKPRTSERKTVVKNTEVANLSKKEEIKTEFIALSYARDPESGQIVRVKVPSSMMVSLGLVTSVKTPSEMIDAEVLVGDDGLTRAIRFIR
ncbi:MAG: hypothetical protein IPL32_15585 [Chloracidobacterium sp.]|nr:hypothetical protein [Chloracidobacterium sp.]